MSAHDYDFDPSYGYSLDDLLKVDAPEAPEDFASFWQARYARAMTVAPRPHLTDTGQTLRGHWQIFTIEYESTDGLTIGGWYLRPLSGLVTQGFVVTHGYGGRGDAEAPLACPQAAFILPCLRGLSRSPHPGIPGRDQEHVLHGIESRETYVHGGCVEDVWLAVSALLSLHPETAGRIGYLGGSFGGGIGALAIPWDDRIRRGFIEVPSFGNHPLRLTLPTCGSGEAVRTREAQSPGSVAPVLAHFDAATAARFIQIPMLCACACFDPAVAPPGQFSIYNAIPSEKELFILSHGHYEHPDVLKESLQLHRAKSKFFANI